MLHLNNLHYKVEFKRLLNFWSYFLCNYEGFSQKESLTDTEKILIYIENFYEYLHYELFTYIWRNQFILSVILQLFITWKKKQNKTNKLNFRRFESCQKSGEFHLFAAKMVYYSFETYFYHFQITVILKTISKWYKKIIKTVKYLSEILLYSVYFSIFSDQTVN